MMILVGMIIYFGVVLSLGVPAWGILSGAILTVGVLLFLELILS